MPTIGNYLSESIVCPHCGKTHPVQNGKEEDKKTGKMVESTLLQFYTCGETSYLAGIKGRSINKS